MHISIIDSENNAISCTPSGGWIRSNEVINDLGFPLGNRLMTFYLSKPGHVNFITPNQQQRPLWSNMIINKKEKFYHVEPWVEMPKINGKLSF